MKPRITIDRFAHGWICKARNTVTASGDTPAGAYKNWCALNRIISHLTFPQIEPSLIPEKESA
jgi:hypothetical protein